MSALAEKAASRVGFRRIAADLARPAETVRGRDRDRAPVRAVHGVAGRDGSGGIGLAAVGAGVARRVGVQKNNTSRP
ncbi:Conserved protein of unknown function [Mycobacterium canettii CIPT 140070010]|nr:Conserved protein of unknown function [Mycobacterium canettii CIPT 140070010]